MGVFTFYGSVLPPDAILVDFPDGLGTRLEATSDHPGGEIAVLISRNRVIGRFAAEGPLSDVGCATVRNTVADIASAICNSATIVRGSFCYVFIDACIDHDGRHCRRYDTRNEALDAAFQRHGATVERVTSAILQPGGFHLRNALDDVRNGLANPKFMRSHFYRAVEALRQSVGGRNGESNARFQWEVFRTELGINRSQIDALAHHAERHGDYANTVPLSPSDHQENLNIIAHIISQYLSWFERRSAEQAT